ncbi:MAG: hypothetical protein IID44_27795 [Planctomycetes bacterium]|nr:hypothetical protein [Planctomycetota bacterium]
MSLLKTAGPAIVLIASITLSSAGCSSSPVKKSSGPLSLFSNPFSADKKKRKKGKQADTIPSAASISYTPNKPAK